MTLADLTNRAKARILDLALRPARRDVFADPDFAGRERRCRSFTMTSPERMYALYQACRYVLQSNVPGDFVECGVWRGGSAMMMAMELVAHRDPAPERTLHLFDTFSGMSEPDAAIDGDHARKEWRRRQRTDHNEWCYASQGEVLENVLSTGIGRERVRTVAGKVEEVLPERAPESIAVLRLDTDWYESTRHELEHLFPRLSKGGVLLIDDYGHWQGARRAVDEFFAGGPVLLHRIDGTGRMLIKGTRP